MLNNQWSYRQALNSIVLTFFLCFSLSISAFECTKVDDKGCKTSVIKSFDEYELDSYTNWPWLTGYEHSGLHWNQFVSLYINQDIKTYQNNYATYVSKYLSDDDEDEEESSDAEFHAYSVGTVIVKENFESVKGKPGALISITAMVKKPEGYYSAGGNWEYIQFAADGSVMLRGNQGTPAIKAACASCHQNVAERDYIFASMLSSLFNSH